MYKRCVFGGADDWVLIPASFTNDVARKINRDTHGHLTAAPMVSYRQVDSLSRQKASQSPQVSLPACRDTSRRATSGIELVSVSLPIASEWLDDTVSQHLGMYSHSLHLNFTHHVVPTTISDGTVIRGGYTRAPSIASARRSVQYLLQQIRAETYRLWKTEFIFPTKANRKTLSQVRGVIEFGEENLGIHSHLLCNMHPAITEEWVSQAWQFDGPTARVHSLVNSEPDEERKSLVYVLSRSLQYLTAGSTVTDTTYGDLSMNDYVGHLCIDNIDGHRSVERYNGRTTRSPRYRLQQI
jgi:hypothetical protein